MPWCCADTCLCHPPSAANPQIDYITPGAYARRVQTMTNLVLSVHCLCEDNDELPADQHRSVILEFAGRIPQSDLVPTRLGSLQVTLQTTIKPESNSWSGMGCMYWQDHGIKTRTL